MEEDDDGKGSDVCDLWVLVRRNRFAGGSDGGGFFFYFFFLPWFMVVSGCGVDVDVQVSFCCDFFLLVVAWVAGLWWLWYGWWVLW